MVLVGGEDRAQRYRHFTPTDTDVDGYAVLTVVGARTSRRSGGRRDPGDVLVALFEPVQGVVERDRSRDGGVETAPGADDSTVGDAVGVIQSAYEKPGCRAEWENHHQGDALGYASREWIAAPNHDAPADLPMAYARNPTVEGAKSEDTVLATADGVGVLSTIVEFPTLTADTVGVNDKMVLPDIFWK